MEDETVSAAGHAHEAHHLNLLVGGEVVPLGLEAQRLDQRLTQAFAVTGMSTQQTLEIQRVVMAKAEHQLALGRGGDLAGDEDVGAGDDGLGVWADRCTFSVRDWNS